MPASLSGIYHSISQMHFVQPSLKFLKNGITFLAGLPLTLGVLISIVYVRLVPTMPHNKVEKN
jgi:hypothetical protein